MPWGSQAAAAASPSVRRRRRGRGGLALRPERWVRAGGTRGDPALRSPWGSRVGAALACSWLPGAWSGAAAEITRGSVPWVSRPWGAGAARELRALFSASDLSGLL